MWRGCVILRVQVLQVSTCYIEKEWLHMKIERVDDKTVKCYISNAELQEYDLDYKDFITRSEKAREMVHDIMTQAVEEVGYTPPQYAFDLQIMVVPEQGLVLTFSEKNPEEITEGERLKECLQEMKQVLQKTKAQMGLMDQQTGVSPDREKTSEQTSVKSKETEEGDSRPQFSIFEFASLERIGQLAAVFSAFRRIRSYAALLLQRLTPSPSLFLFTKGASLHREAPLSAFTQPRVLPRQKSVRAGPPPAQCLPPAYRPARP